MTPEEKIAEIIEEIKAACVGCQGMPEHYCKNHCDVEDTKKILAAYPKLQIECPECGGYGYPIEEDVTGPHVSDKECEICNGTGKITLPVHEAIDMEGKVVT